MHESTDRHMPHDPKLIAFTRTGLHCPQGGFHIDPSRAVDIALITHAHSDHARPGSKRYLCAQDSAGLVRERLGPSIKLEAIPYGQTIELGATRVSFHSAGHILGSAQVRIEHEGRVWVASGDYKRDFDPSCAPFEVVPCDTFITEATFGLPIYRWRACADEARDIYDWWQTNARQGRTSLLYGYALGKAQRILAELAPLVEEGEGDHRIFVSDSVESLNHHYREAGIRLAACELLGRDTHGVNARGSLIIAPPGLAGSGLMSRIGSDFETGFASGWMRVGRTRQGRRYDRSFVISDHADWPSLLRTVRETGARQVFVMHGENDTLARYLSGSMGLDARPIEELRA